MRLTFLIIIALTLSYCSTPKKITETNLDEGVTLKWILSDSDTITYYTEMEQIGEVEFEMNIKQLFGNFEKFVPDSIKIKDSITDKADSFFDSDFFKEIKEINQNTNLTTYLTNSKVFEGTIDVELIRNLNKTLDTTNEMSGFNKMMVGTQLKGNINNDGSVYSFWLNNAQKNLISLFFELPNKKVKIGDSWSLQNLNYIQYNNIFNCENAEKKNEIKLIDIEKKNNDLIAVLEYDIHELVSGKIDFMGGLIPSQMEVKYNAKAEFSINQGKWLSYVGLLDVESKGMMGSKSKQKFILIEKKPAGNTSYK